MLPKLLLVIPSAVEESLTSQERLARFFTHRLCLEFMTGSGCADE
jgi:hypothetical protein